MTRLTWWHWEHRHDDTLTVLTWRHRHGDIPPPWRHWNDATDNTDMATLTWWHWLNNIDMATFKVNWHYQSSKFHQKHSSFLCQGISLTLSKFDQSLLGLASGWVIPVKIHQSLTENRTKFYSVNVGQCFLGQSFLYRKNFVIENFDTVNYMMTLTLIRRHL